MVRNRNQEIRRVRVSELLANPANHRRHPPAQREALEALLGEVGFVGTLVACRLPDGRLQLIDGHLRQESLDADDEVDVTIVDLNAEECGKVLAAHDAVGAMAAIDRDKLAALVAEINVRSPALLAMLEETMARAEAPPMAAERRENDRHSPSIRESWQVVAVCRDEDQQREIYELLTARGVQCRLLAL